MTGYSGLILEIETRRDEPVEPVEPPAAPENLTAVRDETNGDQINLSWDAVTGATGYKLERSLTSGGGFSQIADTAETSREDEGLDYDTTYFYRVRAYNDDGNSEYSDEASASTLAPPDAPTNLTAVQDGAVTDGTLTSQPDETAGEDCFIAQTSATTNFDVPTLQAGENNGGTNDPRRSLIRFTELSTLNAAAIVDSASFVIKLSSAAAASNNRTIRLYRVLRAWVEDQATWNIFSTGNNWGTAGCSNTTTDRESAAIGSFDCVTTDTAGTEYTTALTAAAVQEWVSGALTNNGMLLQADTELDDLYQLHGSGNATATNRPKLVVNWHLPDGIIDLSWDAVDGATGYRLERSPDEADDWTEIADQAGTTYEDSGLDLGTYYYRVRAYNDAGNGDYSETAEETVF